MSGSNSVVECNLAKVDVASSNLVSRSIFFLTLPSLPLVVSPIFRTTFLLKTDFSYFIKGRNKVWCDAFLDVVRQHFEILLVVLW